MAAQLMAAQGPMARSVADLRIGLAVLSGRDIRDPISVDAPLVGAAPAARRVGLVTSMYGAALASATVAAVRASGQLLPAGQGRGPRDLAMNPPGPPVFH